MLNGEERKFLLYAKRLAFVSFEESLLFQGELKMIPHTFMMLTGTMSWKGFLKVLLDRRWIWEAMFSKAGGLLVEIVVICACRFKVSRPHRLVDSDHCHLRNESESVPCPLPYLINSRPLTKKAIMFLELF